MSAPPTADWLNALLALLQAAQTGSRALVHRLGLVGDVHGQAAWPWAQRLSGDNLLIDIGQARQLAISLALVPAAALVLALGLLLWWLRRRRAGALLAGLAGGMLAFAPWPDPQVVLVPAHPTSFHRSPTGFTAQAVEDGGRAYAQHCAACHGADGRGRGPRADAQAVLPPDLAGRLLWRRADGDLFWRIREGVRDRHGAPTMAGFGDRLSDRETWAVIDYLKAQAAGQGLQREGVWARPIGVPDFPVRCDGQPPRPLSAWRDRRQRLRIVADGGAGPPVREDPRLATVRVRPGPAASAAAGRPGDGCVAESPVAWSALARIAGVPPEAFAGTQLIADRDGWLRARGAPGKATWSDDDLLCRTEAAPRPTTLRSAAPSGAVDGLGALIARMDAEPVRFVKGGFVH